MHVLVSAAIVDSAETRGRARSELWGRRREIDYETACSPTEGSTDTESEETAGAEGEQIDSSSEE